MKPLHYILLITLSIFIFSCEEEETEEEPVQVNQTSIIPSTTLGRPNTVLGCIEITSRVTSIEVWDHGQIDGDIVSIIANGDRIINEQVLDGPSNPIQVDYSFDNNGFNYVTLYAHNLGDIAPNTCTIAINGVEFILEANLDANGSVNVVVDGFGVTCADGGNGGGSTNTGGNGSGSGGSGNGTTTGDVKFWVDGDYGCGPVTVNLAGVGTSTITGFFNTAPDCDNTGAGGNFNDLAPGDYSYTASCNGIDWSGNITIQENTCLRFLLND